MIPNPAPRSLATRLSLPLLFAALATGCGDYRSPDRDSGPDTEGDADGGADIVPADADASDDAQTLPLVVTVDDGHMAVRIDRQWGTFDVTIDGHTYLAHATSAIERGTAGLVNFETSFHSTHAFAEDGRDVEIIERDDGGTTVRIVHPALDFGRATTVLELLPDQGGLTARMELVSAGVEDLVSLIPIFVDATDDGVAGAGLFFRSPPEGVQILQNGSDQGFDHYVELLHGNTPYRRDMLDRFLTSLPSASSNWNALLFDRAHDEGLNVGYLSFDRVIPEVVTGWDPDENPTSPDGIAGFFRFHTRCAFLVSRNEQSGSELVSELVWLDRFEGRPQASLERYARRVAERYPPPPAKSPRVGWDSWYVYSHLIDEALIRQNLAGLVENFRDYGLDSMQVDLGWEPDWGTWRQTPPEFPSGMDVIAAEIRDAGLHAELWMGSFNATAGSPVLADHPEWKAEATPVLHSLAIPGTGPLDISLSDVVAFQAEIGERVRSWGYDGTKFDFAYYTLFITSLADPTKTIVEAYREATAAYADAFGRDNYFINILLMGTNYGLVDSMRIGIDTWGCWGDDPDEECPEFPSTTGYGGAGVRIAVKTLARRYYLNNVLFVNHPDQIFFRDHLGLIPQRSWGTVVALSGGYISLAEDIGTMTPEEIDTFRRLIPNLGITGVPQDLFDREYPEVWLTPLTGLEPGGHVLGLYNWGTNEDHTTNPSTRMPEEARTHAVALEDLGVVGPVRAFEFWTGTDLGVVPAGGVLTVQVPPRDSRVVVLRPVEDQPFLVASNRHVSQGGTDLAAPTWSDADGTLSWTQELVAGFAHTVWVDPAGRVTTPTVTVSEGSGEATVSGDGALWAVEIEPVGTGSATLVLDF